MSMKTGLREARLMQDETAPDVKTAEEPQQQGRYTQDEIEKALKNIRSSHDSVNGSKVNFIDLFTISQSIHRVHHKQ